MREPRPNQHTRGSHTLEFRSQNLGFDKSMHTSCLLSRFAFHISVQFLLAFCSQKEAILNATSLRADAHYVLSACCVLARPLFCPLTAPEKRGPIAPDNGLIPQVEATLPHYFQYPKGCAFMVQGLCGNMGNRDSSPAEQQGTPHHMHGHSLKDHPFALPAPCACLACRPQP